MNEQKKVTRRRNFDMSYLHLIHCSSKRLTVIYFFETVTTCSVRDFVTMTRYHWIWLQAPAPTNPSVGTVLFFALHSGFHTFIFVGRENQSKVTYREQCAQSKRLFGKKNRFIIIIVVFLTLTGRLSRSIHHVKHRPLQYYIIIIYTYTSRS